MPFSKIDAEITASFEAGRIAGHESSNALDCPVPIFRPLLRAAWLDGHVRGKAEAHSADYRHKRKTIIGRLLGHG